MTVTVPEPDSRRSFFSGPVVKPALPGVEVSIAADQSASLSAGSSVKVSVAPGSARSVPSTPTPAVAPPRGRSVVCRVPDGGQTRSVDHWSGARSTSAIGSRSMPLSIPSR
ncbi:hypothetical protein SANTM175S_00129 [Streptomyces antimycoticus]